MNRSALIVFFLALIPLLGLGCSGGSDPNRPETCQVSGLVTRGGQAVAAATVTFHSLDGSRSAVGVTSDQGRFTLTTFVPGDGAVAGQYAVAIVKYDLPMAASGADGSIADTGEEDVDRPEIRMASRGESPGPKNLLPQKYADAKSSGLIALVAKRGDNQFDFTID
ncbi:MAG: carboxypeptidase regulatory-like domain-containing protein [Rhodopirellula sp.]|nr:carboxypeptidase regulatory-like domain-containing protein [Rhodopirellula sp.]